MKLRCISVK